MQNLPLMPDEQQLFEKLFYKYKLEIDRKLKLEQAKHASDAAKRGITNSSFSFNIILMKYTEIQRATVKAINETLEKTKRPWTQDLVDALYEDMEEGRNRAIAGAIHEYHQYERQLGIDEARLSLPATGSLRSRINGFLDEMKCDLDIRVIEAKASISCAEAEAYTNIRVVELRLRDFVKKTMELACGTDWIKNRVTGETIMRWKEREKQYNAVPYPWRSPIQDLMDFADLSDCKDIIVRRDNWDNVFKDMLKKKDYIEGKLIELYALRNDVMHMRLLSEDGIYTVKHISQEILKLLQ